MTHAPGAPDEQTSGFRDAALVELMARPFEPPRWLRGGRRQTVAGSKIPLRRKRPFELERWTTSDDDFVRVHVHDGALGRPIVIALHGLEGSVRSGYITRLADLAFDRDWGMLVPEHRSCGGEMNRSLRGYHSGATEDLQMVVERVLQRFPGRPIYLFGVSLGGNMLLKWLGENGSDVHPDVAGAAAVSPPFDLASSARNADSAMGGLMARVFMKTLVPKALEKARRYPGSLDEKAIRGARTFEAFDGLVTAPLHGFRDAEDYWTSQSSRRFLQGVQRPTLVIASRDDPLNPASTIPEAELGASPHLVPLVTERGGHAAFIANAGPLGLERWAEERAVCFFELCEREREAEATDRQPLS